MNVAIFGAGVIGDKLFNCIKKLNGISMSEEKVNVIYYCDNNSTKWKQKLNGIDIISPEQLETKYQKKFIDTVLIAVYSEKEIYKVAIQLMDLNIFNVYGIKEYMFKEGIYEESIQNYFYKIEPDKPILNYLEFHATDHCNLNCKGCGHFSPIAEKAYLNIRKHEKDMKRLAQVFSNITQIRILGGEPLLHFDIDKVIQITRENFPNTDLRIVTNGVLLNKMQAKFWQAILNNRVAIDISLYKPLENKKKYFIELLENKKVRYKIIETTKFFKRLNLTGKISAEEGYKVCKTSTCTFLKDGYISLCSMPLLNKYFNNYFKTDLSEKGSINIYDADITGAKIIDFINKPIQACKYCSEPIFFDWELSRKKLEEWCVNN